MSGFQKPKIISHYGANTLHKISSRSDSMAQKGLIAEPSRLALVDPRFSN